MFFIMDCSKAALASTGSTVLACDTGGDVGATGGGGTASGAS